MNEKKLPIELSEEVAGGRYSNLAIIAHNENEFIFDFVFAHPPKGKVNARVIMSPAHAKRFLEALQNNISMYENKVGQIKKAKEPPQFGVELSNN